MHKVKHNKIRNTGLLFEFLLRQITSDVLNKDNSSAVKIVKERFNENTELGKELALYNIIINKKFKSDRQANYFINEVIKNRDSLNNSILRRERYGKREFKGGSPLSVGKGGTIVAREGLLNSLKNKFGKDLEKQSILNEEIILDEDE